MTSAFTTPRPAGKPERRKAGKPPYETRTVSLSASDQLFASTLGAAPTGASTFADLYAKSYALLMQHPDTQTLFANSVDV